MLTKIPSSYQSEVYSLDSQFDQHQLFIRKFSSQEQIQPKYQFFILHGAIEYHQRHSELIQFLMKNFKNQSSVIAFDFLGHGMSGGTRAYTPSLDLYCQDFVKVYQREAIDDPQVQKIVISHSMGGLVVLKTLLDVQNKLEIKPDKLVFSNPCIRAKLPIDYKVDSLVSKFSELSPKLRLPLIYRGKDLCYDPIKANEFETDNMISKFITVQLAYEILKSSEEIRYLSYYLNIPSLFLLCDEDNLVDTDTTKLFIKGIKQSLVHSRIYPHTRHELFNENCRDQVFRDIKKWIFKDLI